MAASSPEAAPLLVAKGLGLRVDRQRLLHEASFEVRPGERVVLVGPSGTGKSVLLKLIAGILRPHPRRLHVEGELHLGEVDLLRRRPPKGRVGILFQSPTLFDEWSPRQNVRFAERRRGRRPGPDGGELLRGFGVREDAAVRTQSGGQQQRVALARALALAPDLLLYDEPTTGLDPANAATVAQRIRQTHGGQGAAALIVTHDVATLGPIADRVLLLDPQSGRIEEVPPEDVEARLRSLASTPAEAPLLPRPGPGTRWLEATADVVSAALESGLRLLPAAGPRDLARSSLRWVRLLASPSALLYFAVAGAIVGFVTTYFTFEHLPRRGFTEPLFIEDVLQAIGFLLYRVLCPVILTILVAARSGAAIAAEVGNKAYAGQLDALRSLGASPSRMLFTSLLWTTLWTVPLLLAVMFLASRWLSLGVFIFGHPEQTSFFWDRNFHRALRLPEQSLWAGTGWLFLKVQLCAFGTATIAWFQGLRPKDSAGEVSAGVTRTIIFASLFTLLVHFVLAFFEF